MILLVGVSSRGQQEGHATFRPTFRGQMKCCVSNDIHHFLIRFLAKTTTIVYVAAYITKAHTTHCIMVALEGVSFEFFKRGMLYCSQ